MKACVEADPYLYDELVSGALSESDERRFIELMCKQTLAFEQGRIGGGDMEPRVGRAASRGAEGASDRRPLLEGFTMGAVLTGAVLYRA